MRIITLLAIAIALTTSRPLHAQGVRLKAAREAAEYLMKKGGIKAAGEGAEKLTGRIAAAASRYGDEAIEAVQKCGPRAIALADEAGEGGAKAMKLLARRGDEAADLVLSRPGTAAIFRRYGDEGAEALIRHPGVAEGVIESAGQPAVRALASLSTAEGRHLAILAKGGDLAKIGRTPELLDVIGKFGDGCMALVWRNKKLLASGAVLAAFLHDPEPFVKGTVQLADSAIEHVVAPAVTPIAKEAGDLIRDEAPGFLPWAIAIGIASLLLAGIGARSGRACDRNRR